MHLPGVLLYDLGWQNVAMRKSYLIVVAAVLLVAAVWYFLGREPSGVPPIQATSPDLPVEEAVRPSVEEVEVVEKPEPLVDAETEPVVTEAPEEEPVVKRRTRTRTVVGMDQEGPELDGVTGTFTDAGDGKGIILQGTQKMIPPKPIFTNNQPIGNLQDFVQ